MSSTRNKLLRSTLETPSGATDHNGGQTSATQVPQRSGPPPTAPLTHMGPDPTPKRSRQREKSARAPTAKRTRQSVKPPDIVASSTPPTASTTAAPSPSPATSLDLSPGLGGYYSQPKIELSGFGSFASAGNTAYSTPLGFAAHGAFRPYTGSGVRQASFSPMSSTSTHALQSSRITSSYGSPASGGTPTRTPVGPHAPPPVATETKPIITLMEMANLFDQNIKIKNSFERCCSCSVKVEMNSPGFVKSQNGCVPDWMIGAFSGIQEEKRKNSDEKVHLEARVQELYRTNTTLTNEFTALKLKNTTSEDQREKAVKEARELRTELDLLKKEHVDMQRKNETVEAQAKSLLEEVEERNVKLVAKENELKEAFAQGKKLKEVIEEKDSKLHLAGALEKEQGLQIDGLKNNLATAEKNNVDQAEEINKLENNIKELLSKLEASESQIEDLKNNSISMKTKLIDAEKKSEADDVEITKLRATIELNEGLPQTVWDLKSDLKAKEEAMRTLENEKSNLEAAVNTKERELKVMNSKLEWTEDELKVKKETCTELEKEFNELGIEKTNECSRLEKELAQIKNWCRGINQEFYQSRFLFDSTAPAPSQAPSASSPEQDPK